MRKDSCGIGLVANIYDIPSKSIIDNALNLLSNLTHRGAVSADPKAGDGVGLLTQIPHQFFQKELSEHNIILPRPDDYALVCFSSPRNNDEIKHCIDIVNKYFKKFGLKILVKRKVTYRSKCSWVIQLKGKNLRFISFLYLNLKNQNQLINLSQSYSWQEEIWKSI